MKKIHSIQDQEACVDQASDWVAKFDKGLSAEQEREFQLWVSASAKNRSVFQSMATLWDGMDELYRLSELIPGTSISKAPQKRAFLKRAAIAATLVLCAITFVFMYKLPSQSANVAKVYETSIGEHSTVNLTDGSRLILNTNSLIRVEYDHFQRLITLERGEVNVEVAHDKDRPLSVKAGDKVIQAIGTAFNVQLYNQNKLELIVTDGAVRVGDRKVFEVNQAVLKENIENQALVRQLVRLPEFSLAVSKGHKIVTGSREEITPRKDLVAQIAVTDIDEELSWQSGNLIFKGETLEQVMLEVGRYTPVRFVISDDELRNIRVAGLFRAGDVGGLLGALDEGFDIISVRSGKDQVNLYKRTE